MNKLTHLDDSGAAHMVDVASKDATLRKAVAAGDILLSQSALQAVRSGNAKKGDVIGTARVAAIMAAKKTSDIIPLCHPLQLSGIEVEFETKADRIEVRSTVRTTGRTGVEMEALTATSIALLTIYDMVKAIDKSPVIGNIRLLSKSGGKSGDWIRS